MEMDPLMENLNLMEPLSLKTDEHVPTHKETFILS